MHHHGPKAKAGNGEWFVSYNQWRPHSAFGRKPIAVILPQIAGCGLLIVSLGVLWTSRKTPTEPELRDPRRWTEIAQFFGLAVALCAGLYLIGAIPSSFLLVFGVMRMIGRIRFRTSLITSAVVAGLVHIIFDRLIHVAWPSPILL